MAGYKNLDDALAAGKFTLAMPKKDLKELIVTNQRGQTCGIYALAFSAQIHGEYDAPTKGDPEYFPYGVGPSMRKRAKDLGITKIGEIFDVDHIVELSKHTYGRFVPATKKELSDYSAFRMTVMDTIDDKRTVMVPFIVNPKGSNQGLPLRVPLPVEHGKQPEPYHWCVVIGYDPGIQFNLLVTHWGKFFVFSGPLLFDSNANIGRWEGGRFASKGGSMVDFPPQNLKAGLARKVVVV